MGSRLPDIDAPEPGLEVAAPSPSRELRAPVSGPSPGGGALDHTAGEGGTGARAAAGVDRMRNPPGGVQADASDERDFVPRRGLGGGHRMTLYSWARPRSFPHLPAPEERLFDVAPDTRILAHCHWQRERARHPLVIALHGLEGSSAAHYMRGIADKAFAAGFNVVRLNQRNCGGTESLARGLYHSGLTHDADIVLRELAARDGIQEIVVVGYSLGGNLALKLAGDYGSTPPRQLRGVCAVSPVLDLEACVRALERRANAVYQWNFVRGLKGRMRRKDRCFPGGFDLARLRDVRTVRQFDTVFTAPHFGFSSAEDYYHRASALRVVDRIARPALIITAEDDPFVPTAPFRDPKVAGNPHIQVVITPHGGHCGFIEAGGPGSDGYWAERKIVTFARALCAGPAAGAQPRRGSPPR